MILLVSRSILAGVLTLSGSPNFVRFGNGGNGALLSASCESAAPYITWVSPRAVAAHYPEQLTLELSNVPATCLNVPPHSPCVPHDPRMAPRFVCEFDGVSGRASTGPVAAYAAEIRASEGELLGIAARANCSLPMPHEISRITGYTGDGASVLVNVSLEYVEPMAAGATGAAVTIPYGGAAGGDAITVDEMPFPPSAPPPSAPPGAPPPPPALTPVPACNGIETFAGLGSCLPSISYRDVADRWCTHMGRSTALSWSQQSGNIPLCYLSGSSLQYAAPTYISSYGCASDCKCLGNLVCN